MTKMLSVLVTALMLGLSGAAVAAEPVTLSASQLDNITAGLTISQGAAQFAPVAFAPINVGNSCSFGGVCL